jgi:hypothetical protein
MSTSTMTATTTIEIRSRDTGNSSTIAVVTNMASSSDWNTTRSISGINETVVTVQVNFSEGYYAMSESRSLTTLLVSTDNTPDIPVVGLNSPLFITIHGVALFSLLATMLVSLFLLIFLCTWDKKRTGRQQGRVRQPKDPQITDMEPLPIKGQGSCQQNATVDDRRRLSEKTSKSSVYKSCDLASDSIGRTSTSRKKCVAR